jgi:hypothetical protein
MISAEEGPMLRTAPAFIIAALFAATALAQKCAVVLPIGSPVMIHPGTRHDLLGAGITVTNRSDKPITAITVEVETQGRVSSVRVPIGLEPGKKGKGAVPIDRNRLKPGVTATLTLVSVEYADGSAWEPPRT